MDEAEVFKESLPLKKENLGEYFQKISGWYLLHGTDRISLFTKIRKCCGEVKLDPQNIFHVNFVLSCFSQAIISGDECQKVFDSILQQQNNLRNQFGQEFQ